MIRVTYNDGGLKPVFVGFFDSVFGRSVVDYFNNRGKKCNTKKISINLDFQENWTIDDIQNEKYFFVKSDKIGSLIEKYKDISGYSDTDFYIAVNCFYTNEYINLEGKLIKAFQPTEEKIWILQVMVR